eukprot:GDKH01009847.1.p1 GENE.GDKH01009847.1~~GDKH01009847.1.p1  ORF type:complete len:207 (+),score=35.36 GDKH01009847.1:151-771(+)
MAKPSVLFVLGGPGAGKGTQCENINTHFGHHHISAGDCLREERNTPGSQYGEMIESYIKEGKIVPVAVTVSLIKAKMQKLGWEGGKFLIDGFPRNKDNVDGWMTCMEDTVEVKGCLFFDCPEDVMEKRLLSRGETSGRVDDNLESIRKRFRTYQTETMPVLDTFKAQNKLFRVAADQAKSEVWEDVKKTIQDVYGSDGAATGGAAV